MPSVYSHPLLSEAFYHACLYLPSPDSSSFPLDDASVLRGLLEKHGSFKEVYRKYRPTACKEILLSPEKSRLKKQIEGIDFFFDMVRCIDDRYPKLLWSSPCAPPALYYRGNLDLLSKRPTAAVYVPLDWDRKSWKEKLEQFEYGFRLSNYGLLVAGCGPSADSLVSALSDAKVSSFLALPSSLDCMSATLVAKYWAGKFDNVLLASSIPMGLGIDIPFYLRREELAAGLASEGIVLLEKPSENDKLRVLHLGRDTGRMVFNLEEKSEKRESAKQAR